MVKISPELLRNPALVQIWIRRDLFLYLPQVLLTLPTKQSDDKPDVEDGSGVFAFVEGELVQPKIIKEREAMLRQHADAGLVE